MSFFNYLNPQLLIFFLYIYIESIYLLLFIPIKLLICLDKKWLQSRHLYGGRCIFDRFGHNVLYILFHCLCTICLTQSSSTTHALQHPPSPHQMFLIASRVFFFNYLIPQLLIFFVHLYIKPLHPSLYSYQIINWFRLEVVAIEASLERQEYFGGRADFWR